MSASLRFLDRHWHELTRSPATTAALTRWMTETPLLAAATCGELLDRIRTASVVEADAVLAELAKRAPADRSAAGLLLQALRPGLGRLAQRHRRHDRPDVGEDLAAIAWERIRTYPFDRRPARIAANVILDTHHRYLAAQRTDDRLTLLDHDIEAPPAEPAEEPHSRDSATALLDWAVTSQMITPGTADIVRRLHIDHRPVAAAAADLGASTGTLNRRRRRALNAIQTLPHPNGVTVEPADRKPRPAAPSGSGPFRCPDRSRAMRRDRAGDGHAAMNRVEVSMARIATPGTGGRS